MHSAEYQHQQPRRIQNHRRHRPELNVNTFDANAYSHSPEGDDYPEVSTPLSPPPPNITNHPYSKSHAEARPPTIPYKSSERSLRSPKLSHEKQYPPVSSRSIHAGAKTESPYNKVSAQSYTPDQERDAAEASGRFRPDRDRTDWADPAIDTFLDTLSPPIDMSNKENDLPADNYFEDFDSRPRRASHTPPAQNSRHPRDSHDLSLSPRNVTRDSLLGNMLLSLDQFSMGQMNCTQSGGGARTMSGFADPSSYSYDGVGDERPREATRVTTSPVSRARTTTHAARGGHVYSYSSDYEAADDSSHMSRGRRSNSSSTGFQSNLGRINSLRDMTNQRAGQRPLHSRGGRGSKSSSTNSIDVAGYVQVLGSQRWAHGIGVPKRSSSLDISRRPSVGTRPPEQQQHLLQHPPQPQPWHIELPNSFFNYSTTHFINHDDDDDYLDDAAPTPTVPVGPRRLSNMPSMPSFARSEPMGEPLSPVRSVNLNLERKRSNKSARSGHTTATRHSHHSTSRHINARERDGAASPPPPLPGSVVMPVTDLLDSAPAPHVGYGKAKEPVHATSQLAAATAAVSQPPKEKQPGFFRRMFGGGSKNSVTSPDQSTINSISPTNASVSSPAAFAAPSNTMSSGTPGSNASPHPPPLGGSPSQASKPNSNPPSRQTSSSHGLQKKPSGFFRRRKKSVSVINVDAPPIPTSLPPAILPPTDLPPAPPRRLDLLTPRPAPSPVTSLRKAMDPYLKAADSSSPSGRTSPSSHRDDLTLSVYHSAVEEISQPADRIPRSFSPDYEPDPRATIREVASDAKLRAGMGEDTEIRLPWTPTRDVSKPPYQYERTGSFLHDNSDSEDSLPRVRKQASQPFIDSRSRSPITAARSTLAPLQTDLPLSSPLSNTTIKDKKLDRLTQDSMNSDRSDRPSSLTLPIEGVRTEPMLKTSASAGSIPSLRIEDSDPNSKIVTPKTENPLDEPEFVVGDPTEDDKAKAKKIFDGNEDFIPKEKAASWMGEEGPIRQRTLRAYIELYNFTNKSIITSLREVCNRLVFRAETQQVDRILVSFSKRWCDCNPNHGFKSMGKFILITTCWTGLTKSADVIHTICYSIMLLNTDLHMADIESKMTRSQFIKNTMTTVRHALADSGTYDRPSILPGRGSNLGDEGHAGEHERTSFRDSFIKLPGRAGSALGEAPTELDECGPLVKNPFDGSLKAWESQMEAVLKDIYASIRDERLPLYGAEPVHEQLHSAGALSVISMLKRSPSVLSKAPSENPSARGRGPDSARAGNSRWGSKSRSRPRGFGSAGFSSSRTSFDDGQSIWSPVDSVATWSRASLGRTQTSMSMDSFGSRLPRGDYQQSIGFANALSQAIIREDPRSSVTSLVSDDLKTRQLLEDESLELAGPPWVKEGIVVHKHHLDGVDKKAKDRNWTEVFAVIQKGTISIFSFSPNKSVGRRGRNAPKKGGVVGGGNWQENATTLGSWSLRLTLASALPPPGYSKQRPHVWALSLPTGAVHLFHVGTPEICNEFVTTANYWSARLSTHPLVGGVSNVEYGWSDSIINNALVAAIHDTKGLSATVTGSTAPVGRQRSGSVAGRASLHSRGSSFRSVSSFDFGSSNPRTGGNLPVSNKLPGDLATIAEWTPPTQSMRASNAPEQEQLNTLLGYVQSIEEDLQQHNQLRSPMLLAFTPRGSNAQRAMANWERRSAYLLREIVKFRTYVDVLQLAHARKTEIYREREVARRAARGSLDEDRLSFDDGEVGPLDVEGLERERGRLVSRGGITEEDKISRT